MRAHVSKALTRHELKINHRQLGTLANTRSLTKHPTLGILVQASFLIGMSYSEMRFKSLCRLLLGYRCSGSGMLMLRGLLEDLCRVIPIIGALLCCCAPGYAPARIPCLEIRY